VTSPVSERPPAARSLDVVFAPVHSQTAFEETVDRLGTAIKLGLLAPGTRLTLGQSGHLRATRGRGGGTFVADPLPPALPPSRELLAGWRAVCDERTAVEVGIVVVAAQRATDAQADALEELVGLIDGELHDFSAYRPLDVRLHVGLAETTGSSRLVATMTDIQSQMSGLISHIAHPPEVLDAANDGHRRILAAIRRRDESAAAREMAEHTRGTEHILAGLLPSADAIWPPGA
jgi:GntR family transcriptional repressor for pyruvate dehydrogenase complex